MTVNKNNVIDITTKLLKKQADNLVVLSDERDEREIAADLMFEECIGEVERVLRRHGVEIDQNPLFDCDFEMVKNSLRYTINRQFGLEQ